MTPEEELKLQQEEHRRRQRKRKSDWRPEQGKSNLVLTRKAGESVMLGDDVEVTVVKVKGKLVRLGFKAPRSLQVYRAEVWKEIRDSNTGGSD